MLVTFHVNGAWQPTSDETDRTADFYAFPSAHVVDVWPCDGWRDRGEAPTTFHGEWPATEYGALCARRFAASCSTAAVREVPEYWYQPCYGKIDS